MASGEQFLVRLRRHQTGTPWGFRLQGGRDYGLPIFIQKVSWRLPPVIGRPGVYTENTQRWSTVIDDSNSVYKLKIYVVYITHIYLIC